jgi:hypothetical protein
MAMPWLAISSHAEHEAPARDQVEGGEGLGRHDRLALGRQRDAGAERDPLGDGGGRGQRDEGIQRALVALGQLGLAGRWRRDAADRDVGVLGQVQRVEAPVLDLTGQRRDVDRLVRREDGDSVAHGR